MTAALAGVRVLDLSRGPVGGIATMILADFGADVIKVEPPGGDPFRALAAAPMWLRGKQSVVLDLKTDEGVAALHALARRADVALASYRRGTAERLQADERTLRALNPQLVYCEITGFGPAGPYAHYPGYEGVVAAKSGRMRAFAGQIEREGPVYAAVPVGSHGAAQAAVQGILAALLVRGRTGRGQHVTTSLLQGMLPFDMNGLLTLQLMRNFPERFPVDPLTGLNRQPTLQYQPVRTRDGRWIQLGNLMEHLFHAFLAAADLGRIYADPRFTNAPQLGVEEREALRAIILERMQERTADEWMELFIAAGDIAAEPVLSTQEALCHPQMRHNGDVVELESPALGPMRQLGPVARLHATPAVLAPSHPAPGEHQHLAGNPDHWRPRASRTPATHDGPPLAGMTVVELATIIAAPLGCSLLADLGARVIKVEVLGGDPLRGLGNGISTIKTTAGKESICLDLKRPAAQEVVRRLLSTADVLIHNYRPGVAERLGVGYEDVRAYNPRIVYVSAMGYGSDGPYAHRPSTHPIAGAVTGGALWQSGSGWPPADEGSLAAIKEAARQFMRANEVNPDPSTALAIATGAMLGLYVQRTQGIGQRVDLNMLIANAYANADDFLDYPGKQPRRLVDAELFGLSACYRLYPAASGWVFFACLTDREWLAFCAAADRRDLIGDARFATSAARLENDVCLASIVADVFTERPAAEWESRLTAAGVGCVQADGEMPGDFWDGDTHVAANGFTIPVQHARYGTLQRYGSMLTFSATPCRPGPGVLAGQHTDAILAELGYTPAEIAGLRAARVAASEPVDRLV